MSPNSNTLSSSPDKQISQGCIKCHNAWALAGFVLVLLLRMKLRWSHTESKEGLHCFSPPVISHAELCDNDRVNTDYQHLFVLIMHTHIKAKRSTLLNRPLSSLFFVWLSQGGCFTSWTVSFFCPLLALLHSLYSCCLKVPSNHWN